MYFHEVGIASHLCPVAEINRRGGGHDASGQLYAQAPSHLSTKLGPLDNRAFSLGGTFPITNEKILKSRLISYYNLLLLPPL